MQMTAVVMFSIATILSDIECTVVHYVFTLFDVISTNILVEVARGQVVARCRLNIFFNVQPERAKKSHSQSNAWYREEKI